MTADDWWALIDASPDDAELRQAFAAWLQDEADDPVGAEAVRWMLRTGKRPEHLLPGSKRWQQCGLEQCPWKAAWHWWQ
jgi:hypothetical protein